MSDTPHSEGATIGLADLKRALATSPNGVEDTSPDGVEETVPNGVKDEEIVAYHHGELSGERAEAVRALLAADPEWARTLEDARDPDALAARSGVADEATVDAAWDDFQQRLRQQDEESRESPEPAAVLEFDRHSEPRVPHAAAQPTAPSRPVERRWLVAAVFLVGAVVGLLLGQVMQPSALDPAETGIRLVELEPLRPDAGPLRGGEESQVVAGRGRELLVLKLWPPTLLERSGALPERAGFRVLRGEEVVFSGRADLQDDAYVASLPIETLTTDEFRVELDLGSAIGRPETLTYELRWQADPP